MQYMGGKSRIARSIADIINEIPRRKIPDCPANSQDNHHGGGGGRDALLASFAAVALLKVRCRALPAKSSMTATNTSSLYSRVFKTAMSCRKASPQNSIYTYGSIKMRTLSWPVL